MSVRSFCAGTPRRTSLTRFCPDFVDQGIGLEQTGEAHALSGLYFASNRDFFYEWD
jgi:hypothetical protein